ncbi:MAG: nuclear transport factor 2 family protein [Alcanivoracaceae bacterium]|nr:nuclear transport factor 2 family protein [Alcanivoracaceae bacterium]
MLIEKTILQWHETLKQTNPNQLNDLLAADVVFHSPVLHTPQKGKALTKMYLSAAFYVLLNKNFKYKRQVLQGNQAVLEFETEVDGIIINGVDMIECDENSKIIDFKVMVRPLQGLQMIQKKMLEMLEQSKK